MVVGMSVMRKANVVIRDLSALEALGGVTNICSDKTGTLTQGAMIAKKVWLWGDNKIYTVQRSMNPSDPTQGVVTQRTIDNDVEDPAPTKPEVDFDQQRSAAALKFDVPVEKTMKDENKFNGDDEKPAETADPEEDEAQLNSSLEEFLRSVALCNLATVAKEQDEESETEKKIWQTTGEPTEIALQVLAYRFQLGKQHWLKNGWKQVGEFPFDSSIKRMSVVYQTPENPENNLVYTKGAVERVIDLCEVRTLILSL